ncbi:MAG: peptidylprolyl isomerase [Fibrobacteria bacterium]|nr:peptidylprolyl isomerase [Fibrobacteria bacterium]
MVMVSIVKNAKYVIFSFGILLVLGLVFMGNFNNLDGKVATNIGKVDDINISLEEFRQELNNYQQQEKESSGTMPDGLKLAQMRKTLFDYKVKNIIMRQLMTNYGLYASAAEMWDFLEKNPDPMVQKDTSFQTNGVFDANKYLEWIHNESVIDHPFMRYMENRMAGGIVPEMQLKHLSRSQVHNTSLEAAYTEYIRQSKGKFYFYKMALDSFPVDSNQVTEEEIKAYFKANPDSFYSEKASAQLGYIKITIEPSSRDSLMSLEIVEDLRERVVMDSNFEEVAISYSDDQTSAENGGSLGGPKTRESWVPSFSAAAFKLKPGEISSPVLTRFGYHLIKCNAVEYSKENADSVEKVDVSHILIKIGPTPETVDSISTQLEEIKKAMVASPDLKQVAIEHNLEYHTTPVFYKWDFSPLGVPNYIAGIHSFAFDPNSENEQISEILQNEQGVYLFEKIGVYSPGRNFEQASGEIKKKLIRQKKIELAQKEMEVLTSALSSLNNDSLPVKLGRAILDSTDQISPSSWIAGLGFDELAVYDLFNQQEGVWGPVRISSDAVFVGKVTNKMIPDINKILEGELRRQPKENDNQIAVLHEKWMKSLQEQADVENNLDMVYRN